MTASTTTAAMPAAMKVRRAAMQEQPHMSFVMPMNDYVRKDVFDARMDRMESLLAKTVAELRLDNVNLHKELEGETSALRGKLEDEMGDLRGRMTDMRSDMQNDIRDLRGDVRVINARLDAMQTKFGWYMAMFGIVITVAVAAVQALLRQ